MGKRIKNEVLKRLYDNRGRYISGEELARELGVSRQTVGVAVRDLKSEGYDIEGVNRLGYKLGQSCDRINSDLISSRTGAPCFAYDTVSSTNTVAEMQLLSCGECIVVSRAQTEGRDKRGGKFLSPCDKGLYFSIALPLNMEASRLTDLRAACGEVVAEVLTAASGKQVAPVREDELLCEGKKVAGILIECCLKAAAAEITRAVIGIGIYTDEIDSPDRELGRIMTDETRNDLVAGIYAALKNRLAEMSP